MFTFYVILAGHDIVTDAGRTTTRRRKLKAPSLPTKCTKNEGPFENMDLLRGKQFEYFRRKKNRNEILKLSKIPSVTHDPQMKLLNRDLVSRQNLAEVKLKKEFR